MRADAAAAAPHASSGTSEDLLPRRPTGYKYCTFCRGNYELEHTEHFILYNVDAILVIYKILVKKSLHL